MFTLYFLLNRYKFQNQQPISLLGKHSVAFNVIRLKQIAALSAHYQGLVHNEHNKFYIKQSRRVYKCENTVSTPCYGAIIGKCK